MSKWPQLNCRVFEDLLQEFNFTNTSLLPGLVASALVQHSFAIQEELSTPSKSRALCV